MNTPTPPPPPPHGPPPRNPTTAPPARPVELPTAATLPSSFPTESMPVGATFAETLAELERRPPSEAVARMLRRLGPDDGTLISRDMRDAYLAAHPDHRKDYDG